MAFVLRYLAYIQSLCGTINACRLLANCKRSVLDSLVKSGLACLRKGVVKPINGYGAWKANSITKAKGLHSIYWTLQMEVVIGVISDDNPR